MPARQPVFWIIWSTSSKVLRIGANWFLLHKWCELSVGKSVTHQNGWGNLYATNVSFADKADFRFHVRAKFPKVGTAKSAIGIMSRYLDCSNSNGWDKLEVEILFLLLLGFVVLAFGSKRNRRK